MECTKCGAPLTEEAKFCGKCGTPVKPSVFCPKCGTSQSQTAAFCAKSSLYDLLLANNYYKQEVY